VIPKKIWQTYDTRYDDLPVFQKNIISTWKDLNPGWEYNYADAEQRAIDVQNFDKILYWLYLNVNKTLQANIWRYVVVYQNGGFWADMDSICIMPLDEVISKYYNNEEMICTKPGYQIKENVVNNSNFAAIKNSNILELTLKDTIAESKIITKNVDLYIKKDTGKISYNGYFFSNRVLENSNNICYQQDYFIHSKDFKDGFDLMDKIIYNEKEITYKDFFIEKKITIY
jgi:mannosyltransferase OCH1-like enzyme